MGTTTTRGAFGGTCATGECDGEGTGISLWDSRGGYRCGACNNAIAVTVPEYEHGMTDRAAHDARVAEIIAMDAATLRATAEPFFVRQRAAQAAYRAMADAMGGVPAREAFKALILAKDLLAGEITAINWWAEYRREQSGPVDAAI